MNLVISESHAAESPSPEMRRTARFGLFRADLKSGELFRNGDRVKLQEQPFRMLQLLLEAQGELVTREELKQKLWADYDGINHDAALNTCATRLRIALEDPGDAPQFVQTVARRGYRFLVPVSWGAASEAAAEAAAPQPAATEQQVPASPLGALARAPLPRWLIVFSILLVATALCFSLLALGLLVHHIFLHHGGAGSLLLPAIRWARFPLV